MPASDLPGTAPDNQVFEALDIPADLASGDYELRVAIHNSVSGLPINLAFAGADALNRYLIGDVTILADDNEPVFFVLY